MEHTNTQHSPASGREDDQPRVPLNVWPVAQATAQRQRAGRYPVCNREHPGKMLPALARRIFAECSRPGDLVVDPMAGSGTTLVEAAGLDRRCFGVELEPRWVTLIRHNLDQVLTRDRQRLAEIRQGDARDVPGVLADVIGAADLVLVCPPYAATAQAIDKRGWRAGRSLGMPDGRDYSPNGDNIGRARGGTYAAAMSDVYAGCFRLLRPGGVLVTVTKNTREHDRLLNLAGVTVDLARRAGFTYQQHIIALHAAVRGGGLVARPSFWQVLGHRRRSDGQGPAHLVVHEDVSIFTKCRTRE